LPRRARRRRVYSSRSSTCESSACRDWWAATSVAEISARTHPPVPAPRDPRPALAGPTDHEPPHRCLDGCVGAEAIAMTKRLHERVLHRIAAGLAVTDDRARDPFESRSIATVDGLELRQRDRPSAASKRAHAHATLERNCLRQSTSRLGRARSAFSELSPSGRNQTLRKPHHSGDTLTIGYGAGWSGERTLA